MQLVSEHLTTLVIQLKRFLRIEVLQFPLENNEFDAPIRVRHLDAYLEMEYVSVRMPEKRDLFRSIRISVKSLALECERNPIREFHQGQRPWRRVERPDT